MKRAVIALCAVILLFVSAGMLLLRLHDLSVDLMSHTQALTEAATQDTTLVQTKYLALAERWSYIEPRLIPLVGRVHTDAIDISLSRVGWRVAGGEAAELLVDLAELSAHIERMWRSEALLPENLL